MNRIYLNYRFFYSGATGVQRTAQAVRKNLIKQGFDVIDLKPTRLFSKGVLGHFWEQLVLPWRARNGKLLSLANTGPIFHSNHCVMVHDVAFLECPSWFSIKFRTLYSLLIPLIVKNSKTVFTVSEFSKSEIVRHLKLKNKNKVVVVYNGIDGVKFRPNYSREYLNSIGIDGEYILFLGSLDPRKNIQGLLEAWEILKNEEIFLKTSILIVGKDNPKIFSFNVDNKFNESRVRFTGFVPDEYISQIYTNALCTVFPSFYEGFGYPAIEALMCGSSVVTSKDSSMEEVIGKNPLVVYVDPKESLDIKKGIEASLKHVKDQEIIENYRASMLNKFNWENVTLRIVNEIFRY